MIAQDTGKQVVRKGMGVREEGIRESLDRAAEATIALDRGGIGQRARLGARLGRAGEVAALILRAEQKGGTLMGDCEPRCTPMGK